ncbi:hypothetical protein CLUG_00275 [Clavispora lusitaniae ATCC 42720]|uniref:Uncharacterized protein n=1 Tax=Clavispora lusitaniae (strain ATCC 42720) TaxID=306902 RepID=C4XWF2_CLAL4|nr:uncharacterized protein CLUG_00275 [Clavispora lusitaniae ATCC 42720]EEQ36152.1 hypothetical protein CLUG_00275 [Clavispora lusitaniae ATCC 42720]
MYPCEPYDNVHASLTSSNHTFCSFITALLSAFITSSNYMQLFRGSSDSVLSGHWQPSMSYCCMYISIYLENEAEITAASSTASEMAPSTPASSIFNNPPIVVPPGVHTLLFKTAGCSPVSKTILAVPSITFAAESFATSWGSPILTPPSYKASIISKQNAGPEPTNAVAASMFFSAISTASPTVLASASTSSLNFSCASGENATVAIPHPNWAGVFVMTRAM